MNNRLFLTRMVMLAGLLLLSVSCTQISQPSTSATPPTDPAHLTAFAQPYPTYPPLPTPTPSPTPLGGASARLGLVPQDCPAGPVLKQVVSNTGLVAGSPPVWSSHFYGPHDPPPPPPPPHAP